MRFSVLFAIVVFLSCGTAAQSRYSITTDPIVPVGDGLCVAIDPSDPQGAWWWNFGRSGCFSRTSSIMHPGDATVVASNDGSVDVQFSVGLHALPADPQFFRVHLVLKDEKATPLVGSKSSSVSVVRRNNLDLPMEICPCPGRIRLP